MVKAASKAKDSPLFLFMSDLHVGSTIGIMPESYETIEGQIVKPNKFQNWLLDHWHKDWADFNRYRNGRKYILVINGDITEGNHHKTKEIWSVDPFDHARAAVQLLQPYTDSASRIFLSLGTECHVGNHEMWIGKQLGAEKCPDTGHNAWPTVRMDVNGKVIQVFHHMPATSRVYLEGSALSIMLGNTQLSYARHKQVMPDILVMSHRHRFGVYYDDEAMSVCLPAWQGLTRHGQKVVPGSIPKVGLVAMDFAVETSPGIPLTKIFRQPMPKQMEAIAKC